ncbi:MAG TPA: hypothetical protein VG269_26115 [Tepidisphaeraceae bacterium]|nr:hypothetical protein [Tepidisphaeraceae bacterium]
MKILLDHCLPRRLKRSLPGHEVITAAEMGWDRLRNGKLLSAAAGGNFDVFLTIDKNLKNEQNLATLPIAVVVFLARTNRLGDVALFIPALEAALLTLTPCKLVELALPMP